MFIRFCLVVLETFSLLGMPILLYADDVNISASVPKVKEEEILSTGGPSDTILPQIFDISIKNITLHEATISWKTSELSILQLNYGKTKNYEKTIIGNDFSMSHQVVLENLLPNTVYHFEIIAADQSGNRNSSGDYIFKTLKEPDYLAPANVSNFEAIAGDSQITLNWQNPSDSDFKAVRIVKSTNFYPQNPEEGELIYDGSETYFIDTGLTNGKRYYYTAFSYDFSGNFSSGAIISAVPFKIKPPVPQEISEEKKCAEAGYYWYENICHQEPKIIPVTPEVEKININDFDFVQKGKKISIADGKIEINKEEPLEILISYDKTPEVLKTITVTLEKGEKFFSFLLRVNKEKTAYLATLVPPEEPGVYPLTISIFDYKNQILKKITSQLTVLKEKESLPVPPVKNPKHKSYLFYLYIILLLLIIIIAIGIKYLIRKSNFKNQTSKPHLKD